MNAHKCLALGIALLLLTPLIACSQSQSSEKTIIDKACAATSQVQSYRTKCLGTSTFEGETAETTSEEEFAALDRYHGKVTADGNWYEFTIIGDKQYIRSSSASQWRRGGQISKDGYITSEGVSVMSMEKTLQPLGSLVDIEELSDEEVDGVDCLHYRGRIDMDRIVDEWKAELDPSEPRYKEHLKFLEQQRRQEMEVELWIGKDDYLIRQMIWDTKFPMIESTSDAAEEEKWGTLNLLEKYYDFNKPIEVEPPELSP